MQDKPSLNQYSARDILKTEGILRFDAQETLSQAISSLTSSHDVAFIFDKNRFLGVISPYYLFQNRSLRSSSKLKTCAKMPPKLELSTSLPEIAQAMIESKIHFLPVLTDQVFEGIVTISRLLDFVITKHLLNHQGRIIFSSEQVSSIGENSTVAQAISKMAQDKITKMPVVDGSQKVVGLVSQFDLISFLDDKQSIGRYDRKGEKQNFYNEPITKYMKQMVITFNKIPTFEQAVALMKQHEIGSLVIVDNNNTLLSFVSKNDLLNTIAQA